MKKNFLFAALVICILFLFQAASANQQITHSGVYGEDFSWTLDSEGTFVFSGSGRMQDVNLIKKTNGYKHKKERLFY